MNNELLKILEIVLFVIIFLIFTLKVGKLIKDNGEKVVENAFGENSPLSSSVSFILNLGWYLMCGGLLLWNIGIEGNIDDYEELIRGIAIRLGICIFVVGVLHGINTLAISLLHRKNKD